jgi:hypothetical protein
MTMAKNSKRPVFERVYFPVRVAVFEHEGDEGRVNHSTKVSKSFRRSEDAEWENTDFLGEDDLLPAAKLLEAAFAFVQSKKQMRYERKREDRELASTGNF